MCHEEKDPSFWTMGKLLSPTFSQYVVWDRETQRDCRRNMVLLCEGKDCRFIFEFLFFVPSSCFQEESVQLTVESCLQVIV